MARPGGQGMSWRAGPLVLKPLDLDLDAIEWQARLYERVAPSGFRVAPPVRAADGSLVVDGWTAWELVAGRHEQDRWDDVIAAGEAFHEALAPFDRPPLIDRRTDVWAIGDRVAWGELPPHDYARAKHLERLAAALRPVTSTDQLIHGDLMGNVLFEPGLPPAIIDLSPYWRPTGYASAIVVADAFVWEGADESILQLVADVDEFPQLFIRALMFRIVADRHFWSEQPPRPDSEDPYLPAVEFACRLAGPST
jgi:uncharacterized protein (TIGR02569 family)